MKYLLSLIIISCIGLTACSDKEAKHEGILTNAQEKTLKDAKSVNDTILNADKERQKNLEETTE